MSSRLVVVRRRGVVRNGFVASLGLNLSLDLGQVFGLGQSTILNLQWVDCSHAASCSAPKTPEMG
jgi:hypothetical protein